MKPYKFPGSTNGWTMPIKGRLDMLTTGIRTALGIKIYGTELTDDPGDWQSNRTSAS